MSRKFASRGSQTDAQLLELASLYGIQASYTDSKGRPQATSERSVHAALAVLGVTPERSLAKAIGDRRRQIAAQRVEPVQIAWDGHLEGVTVRLPRSSPFLEDHCN